MEAKRANTATELKDVGLDKYMTPTEIGTVIGCLDYKKWGKSGNLWCFFTLDDGKKIKLSCFRHTNKIYSAQDEKYDFSVVGNEGKKFKLSIKQTSKNTLTFEKASLLRVKKRLPIMKIIKEIKIDNFKFDTTDSKLLTNTVELINYLNNYYRLTPDGGREIKFRTIKKDQQIQKKDVLIFIRNKKSKKYKLLEDGSGFIFDGSEKKMSKKLLDEEFFNSCSLDNVEIVKHLFNQMSEKQKKDGFIEATDRYAKNTMAFFLSRKKELIIDNLENFIISCYRKDFNNIIIKAFNKLPEFAEDIKETVFKMLKGCGTENIEYIINKGYFKQSDLVNTKISQVDKQKVSNIITTRDKAIQIRQLQASLQATLPTKSGKNQKQPKI